MKIKFDHVSFSYEEKSPVIKDLSLEISSNKMIAIIGPNGSGKSTFAKLLMGLLSPDKGHIYVDDVLLDEKGIIELRNKMGIVFQNPDNQFVGSTVLDDIAFGLENRCIEREEMLQRIKEYATLVKMEDYLEANPENLSGGQKQRVAIASVLAMQPDYLIFDEATSMLDPVGVREIIETMKMLRNDVSKTIITITHNIEEVLYAETVVVMNEGKIIAIGTPQEILTNKSILEQAHLETLPLIDLINHLDDNYKKVKDTLWELLYEA